MAITFSGEHPPDVVDRCKTKPPGGQVIKATFDFIFHLLGNS